MRSNTEGEGKKGNEKKRMRRKAFERKNDATAAPQDTNRGGHKARSVSDYRALEGTSRALTTV